MKKRDKNQRFFHYNFFSKNRGGLSTIVITLIIILLSIAAIAVVWGVVSNILSKGSKQAGLSQFTIDLNIKNAYEKGGDIITNVERNAGEGELVKIKFVLSDEENSETVTQDTELNELEYKTFFLRPSELVPTAIASVSVAPVFKSADGTETVGEITDTYYLGSLEEENEAGCTPDCTDLQCGADPVCGESCGTCSDTDTCTNGICVPQDCVPESSETTCGIWICGTKINTCGAEVDCPPGCNAGQMCQEGTCIEIIPVNTGKVEETWPGTSGMYFGSSSLSTSSSYQDYYIEFPGSAETNCLLVAIYKFPIEGYLKSHIGFNFETSITTGDDYQIWETLDECQA